LFNIIKFGAHISKLRKAADMTQSELADKINVSRQAISKYERGESFPDISIVLMIAKALNVSAESLMNAGEATQNESEILLNQSPPISIAVNEVMNIAPLLKPSVLDKLTEPLKKQGIDISSIVALSEYMSVESVEELIDGADLNTANPDLLKLLIPLLNDDSKLNIFEQILEGKLSWQFMHVLGPYLEFMRDHVEYAVLEGALPPEAKNYKRISTR